MSTKNMFKTVKLDAESIAAAREQFGQDLPPSDSQTTAASNPTANPTDLSIPAPSQPQTLTSSPSNTSILTVDQKTGDPPDTVILTAKPPNTSGSSDDETGFAKLRKKYAQLLASSPDPRKVPMPVLKVLFLGDANVGKSSVLLRYTENLFDFNIANTVGIDFKKKSVYISGREVKLELWDTAGTERFRTIMTSYYRGSHGVILMYDVTNQSSFDNVPFWLSDIKRNAPEAHVIIVGNKNDHFEDKVISAVQGETLAKQHNVMFMEASALNCYNIDQIFTTIVASILTDLRLLDGPSSIDSYLGTPNAPSSARRSAPARTSDAESHGASVDPGSPAIGSPDPRSIRLVSFRDREKPKPPSKSCRC